MALVDDSATLTPGDFLARLATPAAQARIRDAGAAAGLSADRASAIARELARTLAANFSYPVARTVDRLLAWGFARVFDGIEVRGIEPVRSIAADTSIIYLPCHRSHADYLLMSHVLYHGGLMPPHIAAGDNMNLPLFGCLFRRCGAFFIRRSFKGDALYTAVLALYLEALLAQGLPIEFFIEGGRSRTGAMLAPRTGLLGLLLRAWLAQAQTTRPLVLVPVYLGYEKLPEGRAFLAELAGRPKQRESLGGLLGAMRVLGERHGRAWVSFGEPLDVGGWLAGRGSTPDTDAAIRSTVQALADEAVQRIGAAAPANAINLVALALLAEPGAVLPETELVRRIAALQTTAPTICIAPQAVDCIAQAASLGLVERYDGQIAATSDQAALLDYFRHNVLHRFPAPEAAWTKSG
jgi:glycerol-3-phosphate O-acyltransferase